MKKSVLFAAVGAALMLMTSCIKDDDLELLRHPIHVQGSVSPVFGVPLASGEMTLNDLLSNMSNTFSGYIDDTATIITFLYEDSLSGTTGSTSKYIPKRPLTEAKTGTWLTKDTVIEQAVPIDFFDQVQFLDELEVGHLWVDLQVGVRGTYQNDDASLNDKLRVAFKHVKLKYTDYRGTVRDFLPEDFLDSVGFEQLANWHYKSYDTVDMASTINNRPKQIVVSMTMSLSLNTSVINSTSIQDSTLLQIINKVKMMQLDYKARVKVRMPFQVSLKKIYYDYTLDIGDGMASINFDSILNSINEGLHADVTGAEFTLAVRNGIPLNLSMQAHFLNENDNYITSLFSGGDTIVEHAPLQVLEYDALGRPYIYKANGMTDVQNLTVKLRKSKLEQIKRAKKLKVGVSMTSPKINNKNVIVAVHRTDKMAMKAIMKVSPTVNADIAITENGVL